MNLFVKYSSGHLEKNDSIVSEDGYKATEFIVVLLNIFLVNHADSKIKCNSSHFLSQSVHFRIFLFIIY